MIKTWIACTFCLLSLLCRADEENAVADPFSSAQTQFASTLPTLANQSVSVITGEWILSETDFVVAGPEPIVLNRSYSREQLNGRLGYNWDFNKPSPLMLDRSHDEAMDKHDKFKARFCHPSGTKTLHRSASNTDQVLSFDLVQTPGLTNCRSEISARTNLHNTAIQVDESLAHGVALTGGGHLTYFQSRPQEENSEWVCLHKSLKPLFERKANGNFLIFNKKEIHALNPSQSVGYGWLKWTSQGEEELHAEASDGKSAV